MSKKEKTVLLQFPGPKPLIMGLLTETQTEEMQRLKTQLTIYQLELLIRLKENGGMPFWNDLEYLEQGGKLEAMGLICIETRASGCCWQLTARGDQVGRYYLEMIEGYTYLLQTTSNG